MIRKALVSLLNAKRANKEAGNIDFSEPGGLSATGLTENQEAQMFMDSMRSAEDKLTQSRQHAREVQGEDPLANTVPSNVSIDELGLTDASQIGNRTSSLAKDPSRLPDNSLGITNDLPEWAYPEVPGIKQAENLAEDAMSGGVNPDAAMANLVADDIRRKGLDNLDPADLQELDALAGKGASRDLVREMFNDQQVANPLMDAFDKSAERGKKLIEKEKRLNDELGYTKDDLLDF